MEGEPQAKVMRREARATRNTIPFRYAKEGQKRQTSIDTNQLLARCKSTRKGKENSTSIEEEPVKDKGKSIESMRRAYRAHANQENSKELLEHAGKFQDDTSIELLFKKTSSTMQKLPSNKQAIVKNTSAEKDLEKENVTVPNKKDLSVNSASNQDEELYVGASTDTMSDNLTTMSPTECKEREKTTSPMPTETEFGNAGSIEEGNNLLVKVSGEIMPNKLPTDSKELPKQPPCKASEPFNWRDKAPEATEPVTLTEKTTTSPMREETESSNAESTEEAENLLGTASEKTLPDILPMELEKMQNHLPSEPVHSVDKAVEATGTVGTSTELCASCGKKASASTAKAHTKRAKRPDKGINETTVVNLSWKKENGEIVSYPVLKHYRDQAYSAKTLQSVVTKVAIAYVTPKKILQGYEISAKDVNDVHRITRLLIHKKDSYSNNQPVLYIMRQAENVKMKNRNFKAQTTKKREVLSESTQNNIGNNNEQQVPDGTQNGASFSKIRNMTYQEKEEYYKNSLDQDQIKEWMANAFRKFRSENS